MPSIIFRMEFYFSFPGLLAAEEKKEKRKGEAVLGVLE